MRSVCIPLAALAVLALPAAGPASAEPSAHEGSLVTPDEPGDPMVLEGRVVREDDGTPVAGVLVELVQADASGRYGEDDGRWNPRLRATLRTGPDGTFRAETIRPGSYADDAGRTVPAHIHFTITAEGFRPYGGEIVLDDDPLAPEDGGGGVLGSVEAGPQGVPICRAVIPLQAAPPAP